MINLYNYKTKRWEDVDEISADLSSILRNFVPDNEVALSLYGVYIAKGYYAVDALVLVLEAIIRKGDGNAL